MLYFPNLTDKFAYLLKQTLKFTISINLMPQKLSQSMLENKLKMSYINIYNTLNNVKDKQKSIYSYH